MEGRSGLQGVVADVVVGLFLGAVLGLALVVGLLGAALPLLG